MDIEVVLIFEGLKRMIKEPVKFFEDVAQRDLNLTIAVIFYFLTGVLMGINIYSGIPAKKQQLEERMAGLAFDIERNLNVWRLEAILYPIWIIFFWVLFTIFFAIFISWLSGWGDFKGLFNCTSFFAYPQFLMALIVLIFNFLPQDLKPIVMILQIAMAVWTVYLLIKISEGPGKLPPMSAWLAGIVPAFFFSLLWFLYDGGYLTGLLLFR